MFLISLMSPESTDDIPTEPWEATPGVEGFLLGFFFIGAAVAFLMWAMNRSLRKINHNARVEATKKAEARAAATEASEKAKDAKPAEAAGTEETRPAATSSESPK